MINNLFKTVFGTNRDNILNKIKGRIYYSRKSKKIGKLYNSYLKKYIPDDKLLERQRSTANTFDSNLKISIITPVYNTPHKLLKSCIESVIGQSYTNWELCLVDDASTDEEVRNIIKYYAAFDKRIKYSFRKKNGHISIASNDALKLSTGKYVALLDHDDFLWPNALFEVSKLINSKPYAMFIYSNEDKINEKGYHISPFFKPDYSPNYIRSLNYITHFAVISKKLVMKVGGFKVGYEGAQDWELFLKVINILEKRGNTHILNRNNPIQHIPKILYSWRQSAVSTASPRATGSIKKYAYDNQKKVLQDDLKRNNIKGQIVPTKYLGLWRTKYNLINNPLVSIIIPTKNQYNYIARCLYSIIKLSTYSNFELTIIDTGSDEDRVFELYKVIKDRHIKTRVLRWKNAFNYSAVCNYGVKHSKGSYVLLLNNDTEIINRSWIESLLEHAQKPDTGAVGCKLLYPNRAIQHAGIVLGFINKDNILPTAGHIFKNNLDGNQSSYFQAINSVRNYSAVTAACLMVNKNKYLSVRGFDENLKIAFNDVDFCLKLLRAGYNNIYTPFAELYHHESVSVGKLNTKSRNLKQYLNEQRIVYKRWRRLFDDDPNFRVPKDIKSIINFL